MPHKASEYAFCSLHRSLGCCHWIVLWLDLTMVDGQEKCLLSLIWALVVWVHWSLSLQLPARQHKLRPLANVVLSHLWCPFIFVVFWCAHFTKSTYSLCLVSLDLSFCMFPVVMVIFTGVVHFGGSVHCSLQVFSWHWISMVYTARF